MANLAHMCDCARFDEACVCMKVILWITHNCGKSLLTIGAIDTGGHSPVATDSLTYPLALHSPTYSNNILLTASSGDGVVLVEQPGARH